MSHPDEEPQANEASFEGLSDAEVDTQLTTKRKRDAESKPPGSKTKSKRRKVEQSGAVSAEGPESKTGINHDIAKMDSRLLADHVAQKSKRFQPDLSLVELEDVYLPEKAIFDTSAWDKPRTNEHLADFLEHYAGPRRKKKGHKLADAPQEKGHPHTLVIAGAGLRAADLARALRRFQSKQALVAKLFAKHIKFKEAVETVKKSRINIGVGTPQRIFDLIEDGALSTAHLERIVVDASYIDQKQRGVLDMRETQIPLVKLLVKEGIKDRYGVGDGKIQLMFY